jgi:hypothetical protein
MNAFNLGDYVDVPTRLAEALKRWPNLTNTRNTASNRHSRQSGLC